jgi:hypothetical protein
MSNKGFFSQETKITLCNTKTSIYWRKPKTSSHSNFFFDKNTFFLFFWKVKKTCLPSIRLFNFFIICLFTKFFFSISFIFLFFYIVRLFNGLNGSLVTASFSNFFFIWFEFFWIFFCLKPILKAFLRIPSIKCLQQRKRNLVFQLRDK